VTVTQRGYGARVTDSEISLPPATTGAAALRAPTETETVTRIESDNKTNRRAASNVEVRRSARRRRTISAYREGDRTIVLLPARMSRAEEARWVDVMLERLEKQERRSAGRAGRGDVDLARRAAELSRQFLGGVPKPASVRWVSNQGSRWGSCTPVDGTIRLSDRMATMPSWVIDYVLVHELAHLVEFGHSPRFYALVDVYPKAERARGYLLGVVAGAGWSADAEGGYAAEADGEGASAAANDAAAEDASDADARDASDAHAAPAPGGLW
jgi:predicted metal-dependent hydrolase